MIRTVCIRDFYLTLIFGKSILTTFEVGHLRPFLKVNSIFEAAWALSKIGSFLKSNPQIKLSLSKSLIVNVVVEQYV